MKRGANRRCRPRLDRSPLHYSGRCPHNWFHRGRGCSPGRRRWFHCKVRRHRRDRWRADRRYRPVVSRLGDNCRLSPYKFPLRHSNRKQADRGYRPVGMHLRDRWCLFPCMMISLYKKCPQKSYYYRKHLHSRPDVCRLLWRCCSYRPYRDLRRRMIPGRGSHLIRKGAAIAGMPELEK